MSLILKLFLQPHHHPCVHYQPLRNLFHSIAPSSPIFCLKVRLVPVSFEDPQFMASYQQSAALFARYQMAIHGDDPSECSETEVLHDYVSAPTIFSDTLLQMLPSAELKFPIHSLHHGLTFKKNSKTLNHLM